MGEIKLNVSRMIEIVNRLDDIASQLRSEMDSTNGSLSGINLNINGDYVKEVLTNYMRLVETNRELLNNNINQLTEYLNDKITKYAVTEENAVQSLTDIQNILNGLE